MTDATTTQTPAERAFDFINNAITAGKTVYIATRLRVTELSPKTVAKFEAAGYKAYKMGKDGCLYLASGKSFVCIATPHFFYVNIEAA